MLDKILVYVNQIENNKIYLAVRRGFVLTIPLVITGSLALLIKNFPVSPIQEFLKDFSGGILSNLLAYIFDSTVGFIAAYLVLAISYYYSAHFAQRDISLQIMAMLTSFGCFVSSFGAASGSLTLDSFGPIGVFTAIVCAILATRLFFALFGHFTNRNISYVAGADLQYYNSMGAIIPVLLCIAVFTGANLLLSYLFGVSNFNDLISNALVAMFENIDNELTAGILFTIMLNLLWFFGIHAGNALDPVTQKVFVEDIDFSTIISKSFIDNFAVIGGCGATICLVLAILLVSKSKASRQLAYSATSTAIFNINEIMVFGFPIVLNPVMLLPFVFVPLVSLLIAYSAVAIGLMPAVQNEVFWTTPAFFSGYYATGSVMGIIVQVVIITVGTAIYIPFVRLSEKLINDRTSILLKEITDEFFQNEKAGVTVTYLDRHDNVGMIAKALILQLRTDIDNGQINMFYQPIVNSEGNVTKAEALLRWRYADYPVPPPIVIALANEDGCIEKLTWCICETVCNDTKFLCEHINDNLRISMNIIAEQLNDIEFIKKFVAFVQKAEVSDNILLEVTEETSLGGFPNIYENIEYLRKNGIHMAIDDFGMGQTSLDYLQDNKFSYVKLDGALVRQAVKNQRCRQIISSITELGKNLQFKIIAEYVEGVEIRDILLELGCHFFQGYLYSPAIPRDEFVSYCIANNQEDGKVKE